MSNIVEIKLKITDLDAFARAIKRFKGKFYENAKSFQGWYQQESCDHKATLPGTKLELGLVENDEGSYDLKYDHMLDNTIGEKAGKLMDAYTMEKSYGEAFAMGYAACEHLEEDGTHVLEIEIG